MTKASISKSKLAKALNCPKAARKNKYFPSLDEARRWHRTINREIFDNQLQSFVEIEIRRRHGCYAEYEGEKTSDGEYYTSMISLNKWFLSKKHFISTIVHEMVHQYQWEHLNELTHGKSFFAWQPKLEKYGMKLQERQK